MPEDEVLEVLRQRIADAGSYRAVDEVLQVLARLVARLDAQDAVEVLHG